MRQYNPNPRHPKNAARDLVGLRRAPLPPDQVIFVPSPQVMQALRDLVATGLFGTTTDECAHQLLRERLREVELRFNLPPRVRRKAPRGTR